MKGIQCCGDCAGYDRNNKKCGYAPIESIIEEHFYKDCPLPDVAEVAKEGSVDYKYLADWYQNSIDNETPPVWTDEHLKELLNDFYIIPKEKTSNERN